MAPPSAVGSLSLLAGIVIITLTTICCFALRICQPHIDPREPPVLKPRIPLVGHILNFLFQQNDFFWKLRQRSPLPIATLPMFHGKLYAIWSPTLVHAVMRNKSLSFSIFTKDTIEHIFGLDKVTMEKLRGNSINEESPAASELSSAIKTSMSGLPMYAMSLNALECLGSCINEVGEGGLGIPDLYGWVRELFLQSSAQAILGSDNPWKHDPLLVKAFWEFDDRFATLLLRGLPGYLLRGLPDFLTSKVLHNRNKLQYALDRYMRSNYDTNTDVGALMRNRVCTSRKYGLPDLQIARQEFGTLWVATTNTAPTAYWLLTFILIDSDLRKKIGMEMSSITQLQHDNSGTIHKATVDISKLDSKCPLFVSAYRETIRLCNQALGIRRVLEDTEIIDENGRSYLLKKGVDLMWSIKVMHKEQDIWGDDSASFRADRFMSNSMDPETERKQRTSYIPFGGGKHLCPGRNFAALEIMAFLGSIALGFEVIGLDQSMIKMSPPRLGVGVVGPSNDGTGGPVILRRKQGWERAHWEYTYKPSQP